MQLQVGPPTAVWQQHCNFVTDRYARLLKACLCTVNMTLSATHEGGPPHRPLRQCVLTQVCTAGERRGECAREDICATRHGLLARTALPDARRLALHRRLHARTHGIEAGCPRRAAAGPHSTG